MSRNTQWQLFNELKDAIAEVLDEFLDEQEFYVRPRLIINLTDMASMRYLLRSI